MNFTKTFMTTASAALISCAAFAGSHMSMELTIVSWALTLRPNLRHITSLTLPRQA